MLDAGCRKYFPEIILAQNYGQVKQLLLHLLEKELHNLRIAIASKMLLDIKTFDQYTNSTPSPFFYT